MSHASNRSTGMNFTKQVKTIARELAGHSKVCILEPAELLFFRIIKH